LDLTLTRTAARKRGAEGPGGQGALPALYLQIYPTFAPAWGFGGPVRLLYEYALALSGLWETRVYTGDRDHLFHKVDRAFDAQQPFVIRRLTILSRRLSARNLHVTGPAMLLAPLVRALRDRRPVVLHIGELRGQAPLAALAIKIALGRRAVLVHSAFGGLHEKGSRLRAAYDRLFARLFLKNLDVAAVQNDHEAEAYRDWFAAHGLDGAERVRFVPLHLPPTDVPDVWFDGGKDPASLAAVRDRLGLTQAGPVFCFLGRFHREKGISRAIRLFDRWRQAAGADKALFLVIGRDEGELDAIHALITELGLQGAVRIVTDVYEDRWSWYYAADIFLGLPTMFEETMLSSLEALRCGTPVLLSREADAPYVQAAGGGFVIDYDEAEAVTAIQAMLEDLPAYQRAARSVAGRFSQRAALEALISAIREAGRRNGVEIAAAAVSAARSP
jgi:glycosyltransferase involved in cell wall biosynthesis